MSVAHLKLVDTQTGEAHEFDDHPEVQALRDQLKGAERDLNTWRLRFAELKRDRDAEARADKLWPEAMRLFGVWKTLTGSKRARWTADRFWQVEPFLKKHGSPACELAIHGRVFDHYVTQRKNGSAKHFWEWERIFASQGEFEESAKRCPLDIRDRLLAPKEAKA